MGEQNENNDAASPAEASRAPNSTDSVDVLTVTEAARLLRVNTKTVYAAVQRQELPGVRKIGGTIRILRSALLHWLATGQGRVSPSRSSR